MIKTLEWKGRLVKKMADRKIIRKHIVFSGRVQGVGFRFRANHIANGLSVTGWVKNQWDGTVEMEAQGTGEQINQMLKMINQSPYISIDRMDSKEIPTEPAEYGFHVR